MNHASYQGIRAIHWGEPKLDPESLQCRREIIRAWSLTNKELYTMVRRLGQKDMFR